jgi:putative oxidoreductase
MELGLLVTRLTVGLLFAGHGLQKLFGWFRGHGPEGTGQFFESVGLGPGRKLAYVAGAAELTGGVLLALGLLTPVAAALLTAVMLTAIWTVHRANGLWVADGGYEYNLVLCAVLFALSAIGAGAWSLDEALDLDLAGVGYALAELAAGLAGALVAVALGRHARRAVGVGADAPGARA